MPWFMRLGLSLMVFVALLMTILSWIGSEPIVDSVVGQRNYPDNDHYENDLQLITHTVTLLLVVSGSMVWLEQVVDFLNLR